MSTKPKTIIQTERGTKYDFDLFQVEEIRAIDYSSSKMIQNKLDECDNLPPVITKIISEYANVQSFGLIKGRDNDMEFAIFEFSSIKDEPMSIIDLKNTYSHCNYHNNLVTIVSADFSKFNFSVIYGGKNTHIIFSFSSEKRLGKIYEYNNKKIILTKTNLFKLAVYNHCFTHNDKDYFFAYKTVSSAHNDGIKSGYYICNFNETTFEFDNLISLDSAAATIKLFQLGKDFVLIEYNKIIKKLNKDFKTELTYEQTIDNIIINKLKNNNKWLSSNQLQIRSIETNGNEIYVLAVYGDSFFKNDLLHRTTDEIFNDEVPSERDTRPLIMARLEYPPTLDGITIYDINNSGDYNSFICM